jgi:hypothetical protein
MTEEERRELCSQNYAAQMESLGYDASGELLRVNRHGIPDQPTVPPMPKKKSDMSFADILTKYSDCVPERWKGESVERCILNELARIRRAIETGRWIPVEKELPELEKDVLVSLKGGRMFVAALFPGSEGHEHWWIGEEEIHFAFNEVDGWMPLPEPYRTIARFEPTGKFHKCRCSACKTEFEEEMFYDNPVFKFCPNCAARMEVDR